MMKMPAYVITWGNDLSGLTAYVYSSAVEARVALEKSVDFVDKSAYLIEREEDITFSGRLLVDVFNKLTCSGINRFESRASGIKRLYNVLSTVARPGPQPQEINMTTSGNGTAEQPKKPRGRPSKGSMTLAQQQAAYNELAVRAQALGLKAKIHTSTFETHEKGEKQMNLLRERIAAAEQERGEPLPLDMPDQRIDEHQA